MRLALAIMFSWLALGPIASAQPAGGDDTVSDLKCAFASVIMLNATTDQNLRAAATSAMLYYIGRIDGRAAGIDYATVIQANQRELEGIDPRAELRRCGAHLMDRGNVLQDAARSLQFNATVQP